MSKRKTAASDSLGEFKKFIALCETQGIPKETIAKLLHQFKVNPSTLEAGLALLSSAPPPPKDSVTINSSKPERSIELASITVTAAQAKTQIDFSPIHDPMEALPSKLLESRFIRMKKARGKRKLTETPSITKMDEPFNATWLEDYKKIALTKLKVFLRAGVIFAVLYGSWIGLRALMGRS